MVNYGKLKQSVEAKGYKFYDQGLYNLNIIWVRMDDNVTNKMTDRLFIAYRNDKMQEVVDSFNCTTKAGLSSFKDPLTVLGITGTAIIQPGQYLNAWEFVKGNPAQYDKLTNPFQGDFFRQVKAIDYWRDGDKDAEIDKINEQHGIFKTHWHMMREPINNWSLGCMGVLPPSMMIIASLVSRSLNHYSNSFTGTIMEKRDFNYEL